MIDLSQKTGPELVKLYNASAGGLGYKRVSRFSDRKTALRRVREVLANIPPSTPIAPIGAAAARFGTKKSAPERTTRRSRGFNFPVKDRVIPLRRGTLREAIYNRLCRGGATFAQLQEAVAAYDKGRGEEPYDVKVRTYEATRLLHYYDGYGMEEKDGVIRVHT